jgi:hypothetical protein
MARSVIAKLGLVPGLLNRAGQGTLAHLGQHHADMGICIFGLVGSPP